MQPSLKPSLVGPLPILREQSISVIYSAVNFALDKNKLPESHSHSFSAGNDSSQQTSTKKAKTFSANFTVAFLLNLAVS
jgi:hypothetical protein